MKNHLNMLEGSRITILEHHVKNKKSYCKCDIAKEIKIELFLLL